MTKEHFKAIAESIRQLRATGTPGPLPGDEIARTYSESMRVVMAHRLADIFAGANPRFDRARFLTAAEVPHGS
jgi:hypothetical protein